MVYAFVVVLKMLIKMVNIAFGPPVSAEECFGYVCTANHMINMGIWFIIGEVGTRVAHSGFIT